MGTATDIGDHTEPNSESTAGRVSAGVVVGCLSVSTSSAEIDSGRIRISTLTESSERIPPSVLLPRIAGEPTRLDCCFPPHPRGIGNSWPAESALVTGSDGGRFPLAYAFQWYLEDEYKRPWRWMTPEGEGRELRPCEAIAGAFAAAARRCSSVQGPVTLVIPNHLGMQQQQELVDACRALGQDTRLLWRPVAAALVWCRQFAQSVLEAHSIDESTAGSLLCIHDGIDGFELAVIDLIVRDHNGERVLLPARRRSAAGPGPMPSEGFALLHRLLMWETPDTKQETKNAWRKLWGTPWISNTLARIARGPKADVSLQRVLSFFDWSRMSNSGDEEWRGLAWAPDRIPVADFRVEWRERLAAIRKEISAGRLLGAIVTGELAQLPAAESKKRAETVLADLQVSLASDRVLTCDEVVTGRSLLADGAALYSALIADSRPTYLDMLPRIQLAAYVTGTPGWIPLLNDADAYVDGGKAWHRPTPVSGLRVPAGTDHLEVTLSHEEFETARKIRTQFSSVLLQDESIQLSVSVEPAQGNARVEIVPQHPMALGTRRMFLEWKNMEVLPDRPDKWLEANLPSLFPPLLKRSSSATLWKTASVQIRKYCEQRSSALLPRIRELLVKKGDFRYVPGPDEENKPTAVGSDGIVSVSDTPLLSQFVDCAVKELLRERRKPVEDLVKAIGYTSTADIRFADYLVQKLQRKKAYFGPEDLAACGSCLRDPQHIALFAEKLEHVFRADVSGRNYWLKAFGEMLRYREDATRDILTARCESLMHVILLIFRTQLQAGNFHFLFRNSALCLTFLLRRRAFDDDYMQPGSAQHETVRTVFMQALDDRRSSRTSGTISPRRIIQLMINYLDRKGPSVLSGGIELRELIE